MAIARVSPIPHYIKLAASRLRTMLVEGTQVVANVHIRPQVLVVDYVTGIREFYSFAGRCRRQHWPLNYVESQIGKIEVPHLAGAIGPNGAFDHLRAIQRKWLRASSILSQRLAAHYLITAILGDPGCRVPPLLLDNSAKALAKINLDHFNMQQFFKFAPPQRARWAPLWIHLFCEHRLTTGDLVKLVNHAFLHSHYDVDTINLLFNGCKPFPHPFGYAAFLRAAKITSVLDLHPNGSKMLACIQLNNSGYPITYSGLPTPALDRALNRGAVELGLDYRPYCDNLEVDTIICDHHMAHFSLSEITRYGKHAKGKRRIVAHCYEAEVNKAQKYNPKLIPIQLSPKKPNSYLAVW